jgi:hypothetical protein
MAEVAQRPSSDDIERLFKQKTGKQSGSFLDSLQQFFNALAR